jgi:hypothetical protein
VQPDEIIAWNLLRSPALFAGQRLTLTVARGPSRPAKTARPGTRPSSSGVSTKKDTAAGRPAPKATTSSAKPASVQQIAASQQVPVRTTGASQAGNGQLGNARVRN